ncbi:MerR family transcriptional regulator [Marmoricola endophyticus]|uniref:MerR family transcriptional regulator n=1 Tax=Marmoricola endophyticus TaxID=2040280 RepID=A0A917BBX8_9ACTN|nr:MerR family transcriptional regulator [Marmoricola endophyticus]GGF34835.1 MerR family transcriptional regulator [Marmoricola endophyticus]
MASAAHARLSIGEALARLKADFPDEDIKESKIRFLETEGLVEPERTPSGYRKYSEADMDRLRYVLRAQKQYLPLRVIREQLAAIDRGEVPTGPGAGLVPSEGVPLLHLAPDGLPSAAAYADDRGDERISRNELIKTAPIAEELLVALEEYGLVRPRTGSRYYDGESLAIARVAGRLAAYGIEPRHLRSFKAAADREVGLVDQVVTPMQRESAEQAVREIAELSVRLHASLVKVGLRRLR